MQRVIARGLLLALAFVQAGATWAQAAPAVERPAAAALEGSIRPGINDPYRDPKLDVARWAANFAGDNREAYSARAAVAGAMALRPGERVADIGAGTGIYVPLFARAVGPRGKVYAVDIAPQFLQWIEQQAAADGLENVTAVLGADRTANLPAGGVDVVFHSDAYHHFEYPQALTRELGRALVAGGRMYVLDFERVEGVSNDWTLAHVRAGKDTVIREIESAGFEFVREIDLPELRVNYLLHFRKK